MNALMGMFGAGQKVCLNCRQKPAFQGYDYCGKTCADWAKSHPPPAQNGPPGWGQPAGPPGGPPSGWGGYPGYGGPPPGPAPQQQGPWPGYGQYPQQPQQAAPPPAAAAPAQGGMCQNCHVKAVFPGHPYCSKTCGANAKKNGAQPAPPAQPAAAANWGGYPPPQQWPQGPPQGPPPQGWPAGPPQQPGPGGQWGAPPGGQGWGPQQNPWGPGPQQPRRKGRASMPGRYDDDDDDEWPDDDDYDNAPPRRAPRPSNAQKGNKMCINCRDYPAVANLEFCSKSCKAEANAKLTGGGGHRRGNSSGYARRRQGGWDDD